jgi:pimeloyl-ACP methyl ester carboxylesterase
MAVFDTLHAIRQSPGGESLWLRALYPWIFRPAFFEDPQNAETALAAALAYPHAQSIDAMAHQNEALRGFRPGVELSDLSCPTMVVYAEHDLLIPETAARPVYDEIPDVTQTTVPDAGHSIHWDAPEAVAKKIVEFAVQHPTGT